MRSGSIQIAYRSLTSRLQLHRTSRGPAKEADASECHSKPYHQKCTPKTVPMTGSMLWTYGPNADMDVVIYDGEAVDPPTPDENAGGRRPMQGARVPRARARPLQGRRRSRSLQRTSDAWCCRLWSAENQLIVGDPSSCRSCRCSCSAGSSRSWLITMYSLQGASSSSSSTNSRRSTGSSPRGAGNRMRRVSTLVFMCHLLSSVLPPGWLAVSIT